MRPIFTIHAGEYLVGLSIEELFPDLRVWIPSKDDGIDLLVTNKKCTKTISLQVKFSKDYLAKSVRDEIAIGVRSGGWWSFSPDKIKNSSADFWVLALYQFQGRNLDFVIIKPAELAEIYDKLCPDVSKIQSYIWVTSDNKCWETRGLSKQDQSMIAKGEYTNATRNLSELLNNWNALNALLD